MDKEQINELAKDIYSMLRSDNLSRALASLLYDKGWRRQSENVIDLPCKVGDIVYAPHWQGIPMKNDYIAAYQITNITITQNKKLEWTKKYRAMEIKKGKTIDWQLNFSFDELGEGIFLTRQEAEMKVKGADNESNIKNDI